MPASMIDALLILFEHLDPEARTDAYARLSEQHARGLAGEQSETARLIEAMARLIAHVEGEISPGSYRTVYRDLVDAGEQGLVEFNRLVRHFGSWSRAKEALSLSEVSTTRQIEARFRHRRVGKVRRYTEQTLQDTLAACAAHYGRAPMVSEFDWWRERELQLARAQGNDALQLPSAHPYRTRYGAWEAALIHFGFTSEQRAARLEQP